MEIESFGPEATMLVPSTVGLNEKTVAKYIREQEKNDIALDKLSVKEYEDPFSDGSFRTR